MAQYAHTVTATGTSAEHASPSNKDLYVRIENLDDTNDIWVKLNGAGTAVVEGDECVRVRPNQSILLRYMSVYPIITSTGSISVLMESSNGKE